MSDSDVIPSETQAAIKVAMKEAMKSRDKERLATIRLMQAEFKRIEVDERIVLDEARVLAVLDKMLKQRRDSQKQFEDAGRVDLASQEASEIAVIQEYLPAQLGDDELDAIIDAAIAAADGTGMQAMGAVMGQLKPQLQGRADMGAVSQKVKTRLVG
ncbi:GatB/YqeY domain-containing protein [Congregibacter variabilis]|uniref:GatB/YqeY domain-containing protein n=1 Tax=Congregibacter variabilis TaxID=3081200 RepID=A0ABZ0I0B0_9GAMM|nr:GatB/YqeY domain-containing protein [Congregibacter sp. IMCC43200]